MVVVDTGLDSTATDTHAWLKGVEGEPDPAIRPGGQLDKYAGHGTFIAGVVRSVAPRCEVYVQAAFPTLGTVIESELVETALRLLFRSQKQRAELPPLPTFRSGGAFVDVADRDALYQAMEGR